MNEEILIDESIWPGKILLKGYKRVSDAFVSNEWAFINWINEDWFVMHYSGDFDANKLKGRKEINELMYSGYFISQSNLITGRISLEFIGKNRHFFLETKLKLVGVDYLIKEQITLPENYQSPILIGDYKDCLEKIIRHFNRILK